MRILSRVVFFIFLLTFSVNFIFAAEKIDINTASSEELQKIKWVGPSVAGQIIKARPFYSLDELKTKIGFIGEKRLADIKEQGIAWVDPNFAQTQPSQPKIETLPQEETQPKPIIYPSGIVINEILPNTALGTKDEEGEYIEIFNQNSFEVEIADWKIEDVAGSKKTYTFPQGTEIKAQGFLVLYRPTTKITLNNDVDGLNLFQPNGKIVDTVNYEKALRGQSYNRIPLKSSNGDLKGQALSDWTWSTSLTPGRENIIARQETEETKTEPKDTFVKVKPQQKKIDINTASAEELQKITGIGPVLAQRIIDARPFYSLEELTKVNGIGPKALKEIKKQGLAWVNSELKPPKIEKTESLEEAGLAAIAEPFQQGSLNEKIPKSLFVFLTALALAIFSGAIILILKKKAKSFDLLKKLE